MPRWRRRQVEHSLRADDARRHPNVWIEVGVYRSRASAMGAARTIRTAHIRHYVPAGAFETRLALVDEGTALYARYTGATQ